TGTLTVTDNASPVTQTAALAGTGVAPVTITPASRAFGNVAIGSTSVARIFTVTNNSSGSIAFSVTPSANFTKTDNCASVAAHGSCTINVAFAPTAPGTVSGTVGVNYSGIGSPLSVAVTGTGIAPVSVNPTSRALGSVAVGSVSPAKTFTVVNSSSAAMAFTITPSANFTETDNCSSVAAGASCTINAVFAPTTT